MDTDTIAPMTDSWATPRREPVRYSVQTGHVTKLDSIMPLNGLGGIPTTKREIVDTYGVLNAQPLIANSKIEQLVMRLRNVRRTQTILEEIREEMENEIATYMQDREKLITVDGEELVAWRFSKDSVKFNEKKFKVEQKEVYEKYLETRPGNRTFLLKNKGE